MVLKVLKPNSCIYLQGRYTPTTIYTYYGYAEHALSQGWLAALLNYADAANHFDSSGIWKKRNGSKKTRKYKIKEAY